MKVAAGVVADALAAEHPGLRLAWTEVGAVPGPTPPELRERLRAMADRIRGADAIALRPQGLVPDALTVATLETGVGVWAFDAAALSGPPALREHDGRLVIADDAGPLAVLFADPHARAVPGKRTQRLVLAAVAVPGVADLFVEEALWIASDILAGGRTAAG